VAEPKIEIDGRWYEPETKADLTSDMLTEYREDLAQLSAEELTRKLRSLRSSIDSAEWELSRLERKQRIVVYALTSARRERH
jgi:hypothetical protein